MDAVVAGFAATIQPWAVLARTGDGRDRLHIAEISGDHVVRRNYLCSAPRRELTPATAAARELVREIVVRVIADGEWRGAKL